MAEGRECELNTMGGFDCPASLILIRMRIKIVLPSCFPGGILFGLFLLPKSHAPQNIAQCIIRFVARVFVHMLVRE